MERRVLIVESQNDFALTMASVLHDAGYSTSLAANAAEASRELEKRRPDLVILRAELPDQSGFVLCGTIRKGKFGANLPVILLSSDVAPEALQQHSTSPNAAHGYLPIPFEMGELTRLTLHIMPPGTAETATAPQPPAEPNPGGDDEDLALDAALEGRVLVKPETPPVGPPPIQRVTSGPPRLPKRERRSALNDEDRTFLDRAFASIADRKAELLAESKEVRRTSARRDLMGTPEGKIQLLRDELKIREAQIARISEIWSVRERELLSVEDRVNEKDVEIQGTKMQLDDLTRRLNDAQATMVEKERDHGRQIEDLLLQKFIGEKEVIEVVSAKEKDINVLRRELSHKDEELARRASDLEAQQKEYSVLEKDFGTATIESEVREKNLTEANIARDLQILALKSDLQTTHTELSGTITARDGKYADYEGQLQALNEAVDKTRAERENTVSRLQEEVREAVDHHTRSDAEIDRLRAEASDHSARNAEKFGELEGEITSLKGGLEALALEKQELDTDLNDRLHERAGRIEQLEKELADTVERKDRQEAELQAQVQERLERIGELEGEVEATKAALVDREEELNAELGEVGAAKEQVEAELAAAVARVDEARQALEARGSTIDALNADLADREAKLTDLGDELVRSQKNTSDRDAELSIAREEIANRKGEIEALSATIEEREANLERLSATLDQTQKDLASTQDSRQHTHEAFETKSREQAQTAVALAQTQTELEKTRAERTDREGEGKAARNEVARVTGLFRSSEASKAELEERLSGEIGQLKSALSEATGNYEAEAAAHGDLQKETSEAIMALTSDRDALAEELESTQVNLAASQANLSDKDARLKKELSEHSSTRQILEAELVKMTSDLNSARDHTLDLNEQLALIKQELGQRVAEVTQLSAGLAHAQDAKGHLEERIGTMSDEAQRREELLQNDLANKSKELADTLRKLTALSQEKTRQADALTRDAHAKGEAVKQLESKLKATFDDAKKKLEEMQSRVAGANNELESVRGDLAEKHESLQKVAAAGEAASKERDHLKAQMQAQIQQANARVTEANNALHLDKVNAKKVADDYAAKLQRTEARVAQVQVEAQARNQDAEAKAKDLNNQLALRGRRVSELEQALEGASSTRAKGEKELGAKVAVAETKANEAAAKLQAMTRERKELEGKHVAQLEELGIKQKAELDRREQVKAQEVLRLQSAVQEKSKALKVVELELARYKNKPFPAAATARPLAARPLEPKPPSPPSLSGEPADEAFEEATRTNIISVEPRTAGPQGASGMRTEAVRIPTKTQPGMGFARTTGATHPAVAVPKVANPLASSASSAKRPAERDERTVVMPPGTATLPKKQAGDDDDDDFTSLIDNLGD